MQGLSMSAVSALAGAEMHPGGTYWKTPVPQTSSAIRRRGYYGTVGITEKGSREVRKYLPDLPPRRTKAELEQRQKEAQDEATEREGVPVDISYAYTSKVLVATDGTVLSIPGFVVWRLSRLGCPTSCPGLTQTWDSAEDAATASAEHVRRHAVEETQRLASAPLADDIARGFLGEGPLSFDDVPLHSRTYVGTHVYRPSRGAEPKLSASLITVSDNLARVLHLVSAGPIGRDLLAVWELTPGVEGRFARDVALSTPPAYGVTSTPFGLVRVDPTILELLPWDVTALRP